MSFSSDLSRRFHNNYQHKRKQKETSKYDRRENGLNAFVGDIIIIPCEAMRVRFTMMGF